MIPFTLNRPQFGVLFIAGSLLLIPLIAMQFSDQVNWSGLDFLFMGALLISFGWLGEWAWRKIAHPTFRSLAVLGGIVLFLLIWAELAVGILGTPLAGS